MDAQGEEGRSKAASTSYCGEKLFTGLGFWFDKVIVQPTCVNIGMWTAVTCTYFQRVVLSAMFMNFVIGFEKESDWQFCDWLGSSYCLQSGKCLVIALEGTDTVS
jgi:hypothetical protein